MDEGKYDADSRARENDNLALAREDALEAKFVGALMKANPGLGPESRKIAYAMAEIGLNPTEGLMLIQAVYNPKDTEGKGQGVRLKHFAEAIRERYGEVILHNASQNPTAFMGLVNGIKYAVDIRDEANEALMGRNSFTFRDALNFEELGLNAEKVMEYHSNLTSGYGLSDTAAVMRIKEAIKKVKEGLVGNLETILFCREMDGFVQTVMDDDSSDFEEVN